MIMIKDEIKKSFLVISSPPFGGKHSTVKYSQLKCTLLINTCQLNKKNKVLNHQLKLSTFIYQNLKQ